MAAELPIWWGEEPGTDLADLVDFAADGEGEDGNDILGGLLGLTVPPLVVALVLAFGNPPVAVMAVLALAGAAWLGVGLAGARAVIFPDADEGTPGWAQAVTAVLTGLGQIMLLTVAVAAIVAAIVMVIGLVAGIAAAASDR